MLLGEGVGVSPPPQPPSPPVAPMAGAVHDATAVVVGVAVGVVEKAWPWVRVVPVLGVVGVAPPWMRGVKKTSTFADVRDGVGSFSWVMTWTLREGDAVGVRTAVGVAGVAKATNSPQPCPACAPLPLCVRFPTVMVEALGANLALVPSAGEGGLEGHRTRVKVEEALGVVPRPCKGSVGEAGGGPG